jgi:hypothetical protein
MTVSAILRCLLNFLDREQSGAANSEKFIWSLSKVQPSTRAHSYQKPDATTSNARYSRCEIVGISRHTLHHYPTEEATSANFFVANRNSCQVSCCLAPSWSNPNLSVPKFSSFHLYPLALEAGTNT